MTGSKWTPAGVIVTSTNASNGSGNPNVFSYGPCCQGHMKVISNDTCNCLDRLCCFVKFYCSINWFIGQCCVLYFYNSFLLAGGIGFEPMPVGIKIRCLNQLGEPPTFGGSGEIRTHGAFLHFGFQDRRHRPLDHTS
jgi:acyl-CoA synthetase (AMP-forming)/AMP-acid ligase II